MRRNPTAPQRDRTEKNERRTQERIEQYHGKLALHETWEKCASAELQSREHEYILSLRRQIRNVKNYILHRAGPDAEI